MSRIAAILSLSSVVIAGAANGGTVMFTTDKCPYFQTGFGKENCLKRTILWAAGLSEFSTYSVKITSLACAKGTIVTKTTTTKTATTSTVTKTVTTITVTTTTRTTTTKTYTTTVTTTVAGAVTKTTVTLTTTTRTTTEKATAGLATISFKITHYMGIGYADKLQEARSLKKLKSRTIASVSAILRLRCYPIFVGSTGASWAPKSLLPAAAGGSGSGASGNATGGSGGSSGKASGANHHRKGILASLLALAAMLRV